MKPSTLVGLIVVVCVVFLTLGYALLSEFLVIRNHATIKAVGVGVYWDANATEPVTDIYWGILDPNSTVEKMIFIKSLSNVPATLSLNTSNWSPPEAMTYISLTWNYTDQVVHPEEVVPVVLFLTVSPEIEGVNNFSFDIIIYIED